MPTSERTVKITFLGGPETGKSTLVQSLLGDRITYFNTDVISVPQHAIVIDDEELTLQYRDFASNLSPAVASITQNYLKTTHLFIGCFDLTRAENSLTRLKIMLLTQCHLAPNATIIIVGTGADLTGQYSKRNVKSLFSAFMADLNTSTLKNRIVGNTYLPVSDIIKPSIENLKKTIATQIKRLPKPTRTIGDTTMPAQLPETTPGTSATSQPSYFTRFKNFCKHKYVKRSLIALGLGIGIGLMATGIGMVGLLFAGVTAATVTSIALSASMIAAFGGGLGFWLSVGGFLLGGVAALSATVNLATRNIRPVTRGKTPTNADKITTTDAKVTKTLDAAEPTSQQAPYNHRPWATTKEATPAPQKPSSNSHNKSLTELMDDMGMRAQGAAPLYKVSDEVNETTATPSPTTT